MASDKVIAAVESLIRATSRFGFEQLLSVSSLKIQDGTLTLDEGSISHLPQKFEEANFRYTNCTGDERTRTITESVVTTRSVATEFSTTVASSVESKIGFKFGSANSFAQFNGDIINKSSATTAESTKHTDTEQVTKSILEQIKIKPWTRLTVKARIIKGLVKGNVTGNVAIDASVLVLFGREYSFGENKPMWVRLSDSYYFNETGRRILLDGEITSESYQDMDIVYLEKTVSADDPLCADPPHATPGIQALAEVVTVIGSSKPELRLLIRPTRATVRESTSTCTSAVQVQFSGDGSMVFSIASTGCDDSNPSGRFEYDAIIDQGNGATQTLSRRVEWGPFVDGTSGTAADSISLSSGETLISVTVHSEECIC